MQNISQKHPTGQALVFDPTWLGAKSHPRPIVGEALSPFVRDAPFLARAGLLPDLRPCAPPGAFRTKTGADGSKIPSVLSHGRWGPMADWRDRHATAADLETWKSWPGAGLCLITRQVRAVDIDVKFTLADKSSAAEKGRSVIYDILSALKRFVGTASLPMRSRSDSTSCAAFVRCGGQVKKRVLIFRDAKTDREHRVEFLADGQQIVVAGMHEHGGTVRSTLPQYKLADLPELQVERVDDLFRDIASIVEGHGFVCGAHRAPRAVAAPIEPRKPDAAVNLEIMRRREEWVPIVLSCAAGAADREWRISSENLGRELEEDLSIYVDGIHDHGTERSHSPLSAIAEFGAIDATGDVTFGGCPEYGPRGDIAFAVVGEPDTTIARPTRLQAAAWLCRVFAGQTFPVPTETGQIYRSLAGALGLSWKALQTVYNARHFEPGGLASIGVESWSASDLEKNMSLATVLRASAPKMFANAVESWDLQWSADTSRINARLDAECRRAAAAATSIEPGPLFADAPITAPRLPRLLTVSGPIDPQSIPLRQWLIHPRIPANTVTLAVGEPAISKSTFTLLDALAVATGDESILRGKNSVSPERLHRCGPVIIYNAEDELSEMRRRLSAFQKHYGVESMKHPIHLWSGVNEERLIVAQRSQKGAPVVRAPGADNMSALVRETGAILVVLDPLASLSSGLDENATDDMNALMQELAQDAAKGGCTFVVVHHTAKGTRDHTGDMGAGRGAFSIVAKARSQFTLCAIDPKDAEAWGVSGHDVLRLDYGKTQYGKKASGALIFERLSVDVGNGSIDPPPADMLPPEQVLRLRGDSAPVLQFLKAGSQVDIEAAREQKAAGRRELVAGAVYDAVGGFGRHMLGSVWPEIGAALNASGVTRASGRPTITNLLRLELATAVEIERDRQFVVVSVEQDGRGSTAPLIVNIRPVSAASPNELVGLVENKPRQDRQD